MTGIPTGLHVTTRAGTGDKGVHCPCYQWDECRMSHLLGLQEAGNVPNAAHTVGSDLVLILTGPETYIQYTPKHILGQYLSGARMLIFFPTLSVMEQGRLRI